MIFSTILDTIAPLKVKRVNPKVEPWFNDTTRALRQTCRRAERKVLRPTENEKLRFSGKLHEYDSGQMHKSQHNLKSQV